MKNSTFFKIALLIVLSGCASYNPHKDPAYLGLLEYQNQMKQAVERGEITQAEATTRIYQAQVAYNERAEKKRAVARAINARMASDYLEGVKNNSGYVYADGSPVPTIAERSLRRVHCNTQYYGDSAQTDCN